MQSLLPLPQKLMHVDARASVQSAIVTRQKRGQTLSERAMRVHAAVLLWLLVQLASAAVTQRPHALKLSKAAATAAAGRLRPRLNDALKLRGGAATEDLATSVKHVRYLK